MKLGHVTPNLYINTEDSIAVVIPSSRLLENEWGG